MIKKIAFYTALCLIATSVRAEIKLDLDLTIDECSTGYTKHLKTTVAIAGEDTPALFAFEDLMLYVNAPDVTADGATIELGVVRTNEKNVALSDSVLLAEPVVHVIWDKEASIAVDNNTGDLLTLAITAHHNN